MLVDDQKIICVVNKNLAEQVKNALQDVGIHVSLSMINRRLYDLILRGFSTRCKTLLSLRNKRPGCTSQKHTVQKETIRIQEDMIGLRSASIKVMARRKWSKKKQQLMTQSTTPHLSNRVVALLWLKHVWLPVELTRWYLLMISNYISQICLMELYTCTVYDTLCS